MPLITTHTDKLDLTIPLDLKLYFFFSEFDEKLHISSSAILDTTVTIASFICLWVFGNSDYFGERGSGIHPSIVIGHEVTKFEFKLISNEFEPAPLTNLGYELEAWQRSTELTIGRTISTCLIFYGVFYGFKFIFHTLGFARICKKNELSDIKNFDRQNQFSSVQFEDLVPYNDMIMAKTLAVVMKGRETGNEKVQKMHQDRLKRLVRNHRRLRKRKLSLGAHFGSEKNLGGGQNKKGGENNYQNFITLSTYDYRLHPSFRDMYYQTIKNSKILKSEPLLTLKKFIKNNQNQ